MIEVFIVKDLHGAITTRAFTTEEAALKFIEHKLKTRTCYSYLYIVKAYRRSDDGA